MATRFDSRWCAANMTASQTDPSLHSASLRRQNARRVERVKAAGERRARGQRETVPERAGGEVDSAEPRLPDASRAACRSRSRSRARRTSATRGDRERRRPRGSRGPSRARSDRGQGRRDRSSRECPRRAPRRCPRWTARSRCGRRPRAWTARGRCGECPVANARTSLEFVRVEAFPSAGGRPWSSVLPDLEQRRIRSGRALRREGRTARRGPRNDRATK